MARSRPQLLQVRDRTVQRFVARVQKRDGRLAVVPDHPSIKTAMKARIKRSLEEDAIGDGDWVVARLVRHPLKPDDRAFFTQIDELVAKTDDPAVPWRVTLARHALEQECPDAGNDWPLRDEGLEREDLTAEPFFTIDGEKTRDMDDALRVEVREDGGSWLLTFPRSRTEVMTCRLLEDPVPYDFYLQRYEISRRESPFNNAVICRKAGPPRRFGIRGSTLHEESAESSSVTSGTLHRLQLSTN